MRHAGMAALAVGLFAMGIPPAAHDASEMVSAAQNFVAVLDDVAKDKGMFAFDNEAERKDWSNLPGPMHARNGLPFGEMNDEQRKAAHRLLDSGLSSQGYAKAAGVMRLDTVWKELVTAKRPQAGSIFGSDKYWVAMFGAPGDTEPWGWQFDGHHLALNMTAVGADVSATPMFFGAEPEVVPEGPYAGWRIFGAERAKALALIRSLDDAQKKVAVISETIPPDIFTLPVKAETIDAVEGIAASALNDTQRALLADLIDEYVGNAKTFVAKGMLAKIAKDGPEALHFVWMGPSENDSNFYYRVRGPSVLIEYDNTFVGPRRAGYSNHVHLILRDPSNDYGGDLLRKHYAEDPSHTHGAP